jgi:TonB family protein
MQNQALIDLLRRWLRGETRGSEESRLERAAQEDPFLADAWEGYHQNPETNHAEQIARLNEQIAAKAGKTRPRVVPLRVWLPRLAAAAAALLLFTLGWRWWFNEPQQPVDLAIKLPKVSPETSAKPEQNDTTEEVALLPAEKTKTTASARAKNVVPEQAPGLVAANEVITESAQPDKDPRVMDTLNADLAETKPKAIEESGNAGASAAGKAAEKESLKPAAPATTLSKLPKRLEEPTVGGIVLDERGQRAAGIPVQRDANTFAITNQDGAFELPAAKPADVKVIADDFETQSLRLDDNDEKVVLQRKTKTQKKSFDASDRREGVGYPSPEGGFEKFEQYIRDNLETPFEARRHMISGTVTLEFTFDKEGKPTRFSVLRSLGFGCDQEAEHLIENGPKWRNVKPGTWVIYKVVFK